MRNYVLELDDTPELDTNGITDYQSHIGVFRWICEQHDQ